MARSRAASLPIVCRWGEWIRPIDLSGGLFGVLLDLGVALGGEPLAIATVLLIERLALRRIGGLLHPRLMQHLLLGELQLVEVAGFGNRRPLRVGQRDRLD